jgi:hypothetical protein
VGNSTWDEVGNYPTDVTNITSFVQDSRKGINN